METKRKLLMIIIVMWMNIDNSLESDRTGTDSLFKDFVFCPSGNNIVWPSRAVERRLLKEGKFDPQDMIPTRHLFYGTTVIIVFPKFRRGVPFTVARMELIDNDRCEPDLYPYPSWDDHDEENCDSIINAVDIFLDPNNIIWILDVGIANTLDEPEIHRSPKALGIDAESATIKFSIPLDILTLQGSRLQFIVAENAKNETLLYISDAGTRSIIVYNVHTPKGYRIILPATINKGSTKRDVLYLTVIYTTREDASLYFTYLGGKELYRVKTDHFRSGQVHGSIESAGFKPAKIVLLGTDNGQNLFFRFQGDNVIYVWNTQTRLHYCNLVVVKQPDCSRMATHIVTGFKRLLWVLESNFQDYIANNVGCLGANARIQPLVKICDK